MDAVEVRKQWMIGMGLSDDEIAESLVNDPPVSLVEEQKQLDALRRLQAVNLEFLKGQK